MRKLSGVLEMFSSDHAGRGSKNAYSCQNENYACTPETHVTLHIKYTKK